MRKPLTLWILALLVTAFSAVYQRMTGPTYPVRGSVTLGGLQYDLRLARSQETTGDQLIRVAIPDATVQGTVKWRRFPSNDAYQTVTLQRNGELLECALPKQPAAGKIEYQVLLVRGVEQQLFPARPAVTRFKDPVTQSVLIPHILAMFIGMLISTRAGLAALVGSETRLLTFLTLLFIVIGGFILGPVMQKQAFGTYWAGVPFGFDLTDNKTLLALAAWVAAAWLVAAQNASARWAVLGAAVVTLVVFAIPHSVWGSEIDWTQRPV